MSLNYRKKLCLYVKLTVTMKFNKLPHISIITLLAIVFVVVYLYYTISDVKRIHNEMNKLSTDIHNMDASIANMKTSIVSLLNTPSSTSALPIASVCVGASCTLPATNNNLQNIVDDCDGESGSVNSEELQNIIETIEEDDTIEENHGNDLIEISQEDDSKLDVEGVINSDNADSLDDVPQQDIKGLTTKAVTSTSYDTLRKYCKEHNLNAKGTKDALILRVKEHKELTYGGI
jgi:hypothetical protein